MNDVATSRIGGSVTEIRPPHASVGAGLEAAEAARRRGDEATALQLLTELRADFPEHPVPILRAAAILSHLHRFDEADALLADGAARFPDDAGFAIEGAWLAQRRGDISAAVAGFARVRERLPQHPAGFTGGAFALREGGDFAGAEALLTEAMALFPDEAGPRIDYAWLAHIRRDWPEAAERWRQARERHGTHSVGYTAGAVALRDAGRVNEAAALLDEAAARFPDEPTPAIEQAWLAHHRRDWDAAIRLWDEVRRRFPGQIAGCSGAAMALREAGRTGEAEAVLAAGTEAFPNDAGL